MVQAGLSLRESHDHSPTIEFQGALRGDTKTWRAGYWTYW
jgi:hypothetical protein